MKNTRFKSKKHGSTKMLVLFEIGLVLVYFDNFKKKLSSRKRFKRISKGRQGVRLGQNRGMPIYFIPYDMFFTSEYSRMKFRKLKDLSELNDLMNGRK